jgi:hypothetical protein
MSILSELKLGEFAQAAFVPSLPVSCAVLCVDCERITMPYNEGCPLCGGKSLLNVAQILGGPLSAERVRPVETRLEVARCA